MSGFTPASVMSPLPLPFHSHLPTPDPILNPHPPKPMQVIPVHATSVGIFRSFMSGHYEKNAERNAMAKYFKELKPLVPLECKEPSEATSAA